MSYFWISTLFSGSGFYVKVIFFGKERVPNVPKQLARIVVKENPKGGNPVNKKSCATLLTNQK